MVEGAKALTRKWLGYIMSCEKKFWKFFIYFFPEESYPNMFFYIHLQISQRQQDSSNTLISPYTLIYSPISIFILYSTNTSCLYHPIILFLFEICIRATYSRPTTPNPGLTNFYQNFSSPNIPVTQNFKFLKNKLEQ